MQRASLIRAKHVSKPKYTARWNRTVLGKSTKPINFVSIYLNANQLTKHNCALFNFANPQDRAFVFNLNKI